MRQKPGSKRSHGEKVVKDIRRATRKQYSAEEMQVAIEALVNADLFSWCAEREIARVTGFIKQRPPDNANAAKRLCMDLTDRLYAADGEIEEMLLVASAEFAVAAVGRSLRWETDQSKFREDIGLFLRGAAQDFGDEILTAIEADLKGTGRPTRADVEALLPALSLRRQHTLPTPSPHPLDTRYVEETRRSQDENVHEFPKSAFSASSSTKNRDLVLQAQRDVSLQAADSDLQRRG